MKKLFIISNESIYYNLNNFYCDNLDLKSTPEELNNFFDVHLIARKSKKKRYHQIKIKNIQIYKNISSYIKSIIRSSKSRDAKFIIFSISPYTFFSVFFLRFLGCKPFVYLRSDGFEEYKKIIGYPGSYIYGLMFFFISKLTYLISCEKKILRNCKGDLVKPSQIDTNWLINHKDSQIKTPKLLYVGRLRKEKGIFSLIEILKKSKKNFSLTIVGLNKHEEIKNYHSENINYFDLEVDKKRLINIYDSHNIFILPSFTEGYPMVLLEAISRIRPVIVFEEIAHVALNISGVFVVKRNEGALFEKIEFILKNYKSIQEEIKKNKIPTKLNFINQLKEIILKYN